LSRVITYEIPDEVYEALDQMAAKSGRPTEALVLEYLRRQADGRRDSLTEEEERAAAERFRRYIGMADLGHPTGADNEGIDRDLAREYGDSHDNQA